MSSSDSSLAESELSGFSTLSNFDQTIFRLVG